MKSIDNINIPNPCQKQHWQNMSLIKGGRHCDNCSKIVIDFTAMNNQQIIEILSGTDHVCGRFMPEQIVTFNRLALVPKVSLWKKMALAASILLCSIPFYKGFAKAKPQITWQPIVKSKTAADSIIYIKVTGIIIDKEDKLPLPGATVFISNTNKGTQTNNKGEFTLSIPSTTKKLQVRFIGYEVQEIKIKSQKGQEYKIELSPSSRTIGEVVIRRP